MTGSSAWEIPRQEIATTLFISRKTAATHVSHILEKLGVSRRVETAALAERLDLDEQRPPAAV